MAPSLLCPCSSSLGSAVKQGSFSVSNSSCQSSSSCLPLSQSQHYKQAFAVVLSRGKERICKVATGRCKFWMLCKFRTGYKFGGHNKSNAKRSRELSRSLSLNAKGDDSAPSQMSFENALEVLGVDEGASFDEILRAKKGLVEGCEGDAKCISQVEAAYDALLMQRLMKRRAGEVVDSSVLYADIKTPKSFIANAGSNGVKWMRGAVNRVPITVETPSVAALGTQTAVYGVLIAWIYANNLFSSTGGSFQDTRADVPGFILAIGFGASLFFLRKQRLSLGKAAAVTTASLAVGAIVGGMVESWLRVDIVPVFGIGSPVVLVSEFVLLSLWLSSLYLR